MGITINSNISAMSTYNNLSKSENALSKSLQRLSSGLRINSAADDAAGMTIATNIGSQVSGLTVASQNIQDGTSIAETADGALSTAQTILGRLRDLAVQAANGTNDTNSRAAITSEATQLTAELTRMSGSVSFNGINLLNGSAGGGTGKVSLQIGANATTSDSVTLDLSSANLSTVASNLAIGTVVAANPSATPPVVGSGIAFDTAANASTSISNIDAEINAVSTARSSIGAVENRLADASTTITTAITNLTSAKSRITDVDMASEMANYTKQQVLAQAGTAMLAQANSMPQLALKLLQG